MPRLLRLLAGAALAGSLALPTGAVARHGGPGPEVRVAGTCGGGAAAKLRLRGDDGAIEVEFEVLHRGAGEPWRVVIVGEGRVLWRGRARTAPRGGELHVERRVRDLPGADRITTRATGPRGITCMASAVLPG